MLRFTTRNGDTPAIPATATRHRRHRAAEARHGLQGQQHVSSMDAELFSNSRSDRSKGVERSVARTHQEGNDADDDTHHDDQRHDAETHQSAH